MGFMLCVYTHLTRRSVGVNDGPLSDAELEWAVLCLEEAEEHMAAFDFSTAAGILERVLGRSAHVFS